MKELDTHVKEIEQQHEIKYISKKDLLPKAKKDIEASRLALGFLKYETVELYRTPLNLEKHTTDGDKYKINFKKRAFNLM